MAGAYERVLIASQAFLDPGWLPPPEDCEPLADLRAEHVRLLASVREARAELSGLRQEQDAANAERAAALHNAYLNGPSAALPAAVVVDTSEANERYDAACEALEAFINDAQLQIAERAPQIRAALRDRSLAADEKRAEARRLLAEADRLAAEPITLDGWLARYDGRYHLGPIAYGVLDQAMPVEAPEMFKEIAGLTSRGVIEIGDDNLITDEEMEAINNAA